jgi:2-C-methyl-D-erythritol 2,4-cyclodiphosphate synthase
MNIRVGFGYDVHRLQEGHELWLGGILLQYDKGAVGHSDADVLVHAICDALLGAAGLRDIGHHFPDTDPAYKGIDSKKLLVRVVALLAENQWKLGNVDATVCLEKPKIAPHIPFMQKCLSELLQVPQGAVSIKATTNEKMGFVGREDGIAAYAVALIHQ